MSVRVHALTFFALPGTCEVTPKFPSWPATLQPPCFGRKPKARVVTLIKIPYKQDDTPPNSSKDPKVGPKRNNEKRKELR